MSDYEINNNYEIADNLVKIGSIQNAKFIIPLATGGNENKLHLLNQILDLPKTDSEIHTINKELISLPAGKRLGYDHKARYLLGNYVDETEFEFPPSKMHVISRYFVTLKYKNEYYVLLIQEDLRRANNSNYNMPLCLTGGYKYCPIFNVPGLIESVVCDDVVPKTVRAVKHIYNEHMKTVRTQENGGLLHFVRRMDIMSELFNALGVTGFNFNKINPMLENGREYIEYWRSDNGHTHVTYDCNYIREFFVQNFDNTGGLENFCDIRHLLDWDCSYHRKFFPLSIFESYLDSIVLRESLNGEVNDLLYFEGLKISECVVDVILHYRENLKRNSIMVEDSYLSSQNTGILFKIDIDNSIFDTAINKSIFDRQIYSAFEQSLVVGGISRYQIEKYQLIGALPVDIFLGAVSESEDAKVEIINFPYLIKYLYKNVLPLISKNSEVHFTCTLISGDYNYGKIIDICATRPGFAGEGYEQLQLISNKINEEKQRMPKKNCADYVDCDIVHTTQGILFGWNKSENDLFKVITTKFSDICEYKPNTSKDTDLCFMFWKYPFDTGNLEISEDTEA